MGFVIVLDDTWRMRVAVLPLSISWCIRCRQAFRCTIFYELSEVHEVLAPHVLFWVIGLETLWRSSQEVPTPKEPSIVDLQTLFRSLLHILYRHGLCFNSLRILGKQCFWKIPYSRTQFILVCVHHSSLRSTNLVPLLMARIVLPCTSRITTLQICNTCIVAFLQVSHVQWVSSCSMFFSVAHATYDISALYMLHWRVWVDGLSCSCVPLSEPVIACLQLPPHQHCFCLRKLRVAGA